MEKWLGIVGFSLSAAVYLFSFLLLLFTQTKSRQKTLLVLTLGLSMVWSVVLALQIYYEFNLFSVISLETLRNVFWVGMLCNILRHDETILALISGSRSRVLISILLVLCVFIELVTDPTVGAYDIFLVMHLAQSVFVLSLIEQLYRRTQAAHKWKIKPLCLGLGVLFTYDLAFFSDALLMQRVDENFLYGRGWISLISAPLILLSVRRIQTWSSRIYISRDILFHSTLLIVSGAYLLAMAMTGYLIKYLGYSWSNIAQYVFLALSCSVLVSLFLSESLRNQLKVFIVKHFYENKYDYREEWMKFATTLENNSETPYHVALNSMMKPFGCEQGILFELSNNRLIERANCNTSPNAYQTQLLDMSRNAVENQWIVDIDELKSGKSKTPFEFSRQDIEAIDDIKYIVPIAEPGSFNFVCLLSKITSSNKIDFEDRDLMRVISKQLSVFINLHITSMKLAESQQFSAFNQMSTFLVHDLKNVLAQLELLSKNAQKHKHNAEFIDDAFVTIDSASARLSKVLSHLRKHRIQESIAETTNICDVVIEACNERMSALPKPVFDSKFQDKVLISADKERIKNVFSHLIQNSQDATGSDGCVKVSRIDREGYFGVSIEDDGIGMSEEFITNRLFKPFDTTKGNAGMGIGAYDAKKLIEQLDGYIEVRSEEGVGSRFEVYIPTGH